MRRIYSEDSKMLELYLKEEEYDSDTLKDDINEYPDVEKSNISREMRNINIIKDIRKYIENYRCM